MTGRIIWFGLLLILAGVCVGVQLDRQSRKDTHLASIVPEPLRSSSQRVITAYALEAGANDMALAEARKLVQRRPMPARHLRLLAQAQFAAGDPEASSITIQYAAKRGWRDPLAQVAMLEIARNVGDRAEAARRFAALFMIRDADQDQLAQIAQDLFAQSGGEERAVLAEIVGGADRWHAAFLQRGARVLPPDAFAEILKITMGQGVRYECRRLEQAGQTITKRSEASGNRVDALIKRHC